MTAHSIREESNHGTKTTPPVRPLLPRGRSLWKYRRCRPARRKSPSGASSRWPLCLCLPSVRVCSISPYIGGQSLPVQRQACAKSAAKPEVLLRVIRGLPPPVQHPKPAVSAMRLRVLLWDMTWRTRCPTILSSAQRIPGKRAAGANTAQAASRNS